MYKRTIGIFVVLVIMMFSVISRVYQIITMAESQVAFDQSGVLVEVDQLRGTIYDCNMKPITNRETVYKASVAPTPQAVITLSELLSGEEEETALERLSEGNPVVVEVPNGFSAELAYVFKTYKRYADTPAAAHIIGYVDGSGNGVSGIEKSYDGILKRDAPLSVRYATDARGQVLLGVPAEVTGENQDVTEGVALTLDSRLQKIAEQTAKRRLDAGAVLIGEVSTGKIRACVSLPDFDANDISRYLNDENAPLINRAFTSYNVGSVFKICVAAAALESGVSSDYTYECTAHIQVENLSFTCPSAHGSVNIQKAIEQSCNTYFVHLAEKAGARNIYNMAKNMGFGHSRLLCTGIESEAGKLTDLKDILTQPAALANFAFGQGDLMATPLQIMNMTLSVVSGGEYIPNSIVEGMVGNDGKLQPEETSPAVRVMSKETAELIRNYLVDVISQGTGAAAMPAAGGAGGKTATAETGWMDGDRPINQAWFTGFYPAENPQYVITVLAEDGESGGETAAPVFKEIADAIAKL